MTEHQHDDRSEFGRRCSEDDRAGPAWAATAVAARADEWAADRILDPGDSHGKGEPSLCVGEAA